MSYDNLRLAYTSLENKSCEECSKSIKAQQLKFSTGENKQEFAGKYECTCGAEHNIRVVIRDEEVYSEIVLDNERRSSSTTPKGTLRRKAEDIHSAMQAANELIAAIRVLEVNWDRLIRTSDRLPGWSQRNLDIDLYELEQSTDTKVTLSFEKSADVDKFYTDIHNYLSGAYTFMQVIESVNSDIPVWNSKLHNEYENHQQSNKVIEGLRIFVQHEAILPVSFQLNTDESNDRVTDFVIELEEALTLPSQINEQSPDGYKKGADEYYSRVEGESINVTQKAAEFQQSALELTLSILTTFYDEREEEIEMYETYEPIDMRKEEFISKLRDGFPNN